MAAKHIVTCRVCKKKFDAQPDGENSYWIMPSQRFYYHKDCYTEWKTQSDVNVKAQDETYISLIYDYLSRDLKVSYNYHLCETQRKKMIQKNHFTNKGIFFALKYFYDIKRGDWEKGYGGLGIVEYVYGDSTQYWKEQVSKQATILEDITRQMTARKNMEVKKVNKKEKKKKEFNLWSEMEKIDE